MKKFLIACAALCWSFGAAAQESEIINADVQKSLAETQAAMQKSVEQMDRQMQKVMPVVAESMTQMMQDFFKTLPPLMKSIEQNQVLSKAADQMSKELDSQIREAGNSLGDFEEYRRQKAAAGNDKFLIAGSKNDNGKTLDFAFSQNEERLRELQQAFATQTSPQGKATFRLSDLKNRKLEAPGFRLEFIDGRSYLVYEEGNNYCYVTGIAENDIVVRVLTTGPDAPNRARNFIKNSRRQMIYS